MAALAAAGCREEVESFFRSEKKKLKITKKTSFGRRPREWRALDKEARGRRNELSLSRSRQISSSLRLSHSKGIPSTALRAFARVETG